MRTAFKTTPATLPKDSQSATSIPWYCHAVLLGATSIIIGGIWDISWHSTIGRDTFWTPAHMAIYLGGVVAGLSCGWAALRATFWGPPEERARAVAIWRCRAPLGAWVVMWGAIAMLTSAPFDDWWHNAYGLDVEILSPPHTVLATGIFAIGIGGLLLALAAQNRASGAVEKRGGLLCAYAVGILLTMAATFLTDYSYANRQHTSVFYTASCMTYPLYLLVAAKTSKVRWPATAAAASYTLLVLSLVWILPLFPAEPKLAPIYNHLDHMTPPPFPLLLIVPAFCIDLVLRPLSSWRSRTGVWLQAVLLGSTFLAVFLLTQWPFAKFLISPAADNWFFAGKRFFGYFNQLGDWTGRFWDMDKDPLTRAGLGMALVLAILAARVGLACGNWMATVKR